ncbi:MAG: carbohydrate ABC transporter permease [Oscillospiraceae bacterium]|nr:carbohydrate ABC transporter permease [Oscillospiraceae bacterium]
MDYNNSADSRKAKAQLTALRVLVYAILIFLSILCLFSFYMLIINASRSNGQLQAGFTLIPGGHMMDNLKNAWTDASINIPRGLLNSFMIAALTAVLTTYFSALTAYGIHAYDFKLKNIAFTFIMAIMVIPSQVSAAGFVQICYKYNLTNNFLMLILPGIAAPVVFFYMKQYMESTLPMEIVEAARVDGSNEFRTFNTIILPMMKPAIAVQLIFSFVQSWNNYFLPSLLLTKAEMKTVPIMIAQLRSADYSKFDMGKVYMFILLAILPVLVVYIFLSRSIIKGVTAGSVKG